ncbi:MAG: hypothetical protein NVS2B3_09260 [Vulcanimicrobiaceae bacterium]
MRSSGRLDDDAFVADRFVIPQAYGTDADPIGPAFDGYWSGERYNGWVVAYFTYEQAMAILETSLTVMEGKPFYRGRYAPELDAFVFNDGVHALEIYNGVSFRIGGRSVRLYNLGGRGNWIWQTAAQFSGRLRDGTVSDGPQERGTMNAANYPTTLDWGAVVARYKNGAEIPGAASVTVTGVDDDYVYVKHRLWSDRFSRKHMARAVSLLAAGKMSREKSSFIEQYRLFASEERPTTAAWIMKDLGFLS